MHELLIARNGESETERETGKKQDRQIVREREGKEERKRERDRTSYKQREFTPRGNLIFSENTKSIKRKSAL